MRLEIVVFAPLLDVEAGTGAVGVLIVSVDRGDGVFFHQVLDKLEENKTLRLGSGVGGVAVGIKSTDIGNADALDVVAGAMGADLLDGATRMDAAIGIYDIVITNVVPTKAFMVAADALHGAVGIGTGSGAMENDFGDWAHFFVSLMGLMGLMGVFGLRRCRSIPNNRWDRYDRVLERGPGWILSLALSGLVRD